MKQHDEKLIWEAYINEDDISHSQYQGSDELEPMARIEPQEMGEERPADLESFEEGDHVEIHPRVGGGVGEIVEMSPSGTHGIIELSEDMEDGLAQGDRVAVHISDMSHVNGEEEPVDVDDLDPEDDVPYESNQVGARDDKKLGEAEVQKSGHQWFADRLAKGTKWARKPGQKSALQDAADWAAKGTESLRKVKESEADPMHPNPPHVYDTGKSSVPKGTPKSRMKEWKEKNKDKPGLAYPGDKAAQKELDEDCGCHALDGHNDLAGDKPRGGHGLAVKMHDDLTDHKKPVIKVIKLKKKPALPGKIMKAITSALGFGESNAVNEDYDADFERDEAHSTAGLSSFSSKEEANSWSAAETIEWHGNEVIAAGADFLDQELLHPKVNNLEDVHKDLLDDLAGMVIHNLQKSGNLPNRLDYEDYMDERNEYKDAIEEYLADHFDEMVDLAEDRATERGDRPPLDTI